MSHVHCNGFGGGWEPNTIVHTTAHPLWLNLNAIGLSVDIRACSRLAVKRRLGHNTRSHIRPRVVEMYFRRFPRYPFRRAPSKRPISQTRMVSPCALFAARRRMPTDRRRLLLARRAALPKTTAELPPELTCKAERMISSGGGII